MNNNVDGNIVVIIIGLSCDQRVLRHRAHNTVAHLLFLASGIFLGAHARARALLARSRAHLNA